MIIDCTSDLHGHHPFLQGGDLLIIAGDLTGQEKAVEYLQFCTWVARQRYKQTIIVAGNHDGLIEKKLVPLNSIDRITYLRDSGTEFQGLKIWGSPWTKAFEGMNPLCKAFTKDTEEELSKPFKRIPRHTDILVTHSPPYGILDKCSKHNETHRYGSEALLARVIKVKPKLHVFGHIHEGYGSILGNASEGETTFVNASHMNRVYDPINKPIRVIL